MFTLGGHEVGVRDDGWTVNTADGSLAAHWENTIAVTADGPRLLTAMPEAVLAAAAAVPAAS
jgi:methionyl aminopeptidase